MHTQLARCGEAHVVDLGAGSGVLSLWAAASDASSVVAVEALDSLCHVARTNCALNRLSDKVSVLHCDITTMQRGLHVRKAGANVAVFDLFDAGKAGTWQQVYER